LFAILLNSINILLVAAANCFQENIRVEPEIILPQLFTESEIDVLQVIVTRVTDSVFAEVGFVFPVKLGCVIGSPRACLRIAAIQEKHLDSVCVDLCRLTELTFGTSKAEFKRFVVISFRTF
jgi:pyruvate,orthophosphate dikinase